MDDVSGLADKSNVFSNFLTFSQKFKYSYVYIFHIIYPENMEISSGENENFKYLPRFHSTVERDENYSSKLY